MTATGTTEVVCIGDIKVKKESLTRYPKLAESLQEQKTSVVLVWCTQHDKSIDALSEQDMQEITQLPLWSPHDESHLQQQQELRTKETESQ